MTGCLQRCWIFGVEKKKRKGAVSKQVWPPFNPQSFWTEWDLMCWAHLTALWGDDCSQTQRPILFLCFSGINKPALFPSFNSDTDYLFEQLEKWVLSFFSILGSVPALFRCCCQPDSRRCSGPGLEWLSVKKCPKFETEFIEMSLKCASLVIAAIAPLTRLCSILQVTVHFFHGCRRSARVWAADNRTNCQRQQENILARCWGSVSLVSCFALTASCSWFY